MQSKVLPTRDIRVTSPKLDTVAGEMGRRSRTLKGYTQVS